MRWVLNAAYAGLLVLIAPLILWKMLRHGRYRRGWWQRMTGRVTIRVSGRPRVWFHAVSVGEVVQLAKVVEAFCHATEDRCQVVVSTSTDTGYDLAVQRMPAHQVIWFPLDFSWAVAAVLNRIQPSLLVLMELELWPNLIACCRRQGVPVAVINARMSPKSFKGYRRAGALIRPLFRSLTRVAAQSQDYADRLTALGVDEDRVVVTGSVKFDGLSTDRSQSRTSQLRELFGLSTEDLVIVAGSTQPPEEAHIIQVWKQLRNEYPGLRLILVPRHKERFEEVADLIAAQGHGVARWTALQQDSAVPSHQVDQHSIGLLDTIGELSSCWGLADIALVGGSFGSRGGQNMMEPAAYGAAVVFGPNTWNFRDVVAAFHAANACVQLNGFDELLPRIRHLVADSEARTALGVRAQQVVLSNEGATQATAELLAGMLADAAAVAVHSTGNKAA